MLNLHQPHNRNVRCTGLAAGLPGEYRIFRRWTPALQGKHLWSTDRAPAKEWSMQHKKVW